jgi:hypothetical protein
VPALARTADLTRSLSIPNTRALATMDLKTASSPTGDMTGPSATPADRSPDDTLSMGNTFSTPSSLDTDNAKSPSPTHPRTGCPSAAAAAGASAHVATGSDTAGSSAIFNSTSTSISTSGNNNGEPSATGVEDVGLPEPVAPSPLPPSDASDGLTSSLRNTIDGE